MHWKKVSALSLAIGAAAFFGLRPVAARGAETIVSAGPRDAAEEAKAFHLPPGFEAQLVASEPEIHKPINIAFDDKGRLWVTDTVEYPFPVAAGKPSRDTVKILDDFAPDGHARKVTTFADNLNIPIGVLPQRGRDGRDSAIVYSIPGIWRFTDTKGTGTADERKLIVTGQAHDDTHGMTGSFNEGFDGWIYAVHGFRNSSTLTGTDGSQISMTSGHTYRFQPDGSRLQINTSGQVNPFGMCFDPLGNLFTSDCETMPILLTLRGAYYSSFGRPHDGLGFGPDITDHMYGSSAIAGLVDYVAPNFPAEYQNMMLVGNVVTNKINRAQLVPKGSAFHGDDAPDFMVSDDHWFRPVCIKIGPDGALYVADFYNRIIGHYEVDLHHPGRDKQRGRIWRIAYTGAGAQPSVIKPFDLTKAPMPELIVDLSDPNFSIRMLAMNYLADVVGPPAAAPIEAALGKPSSPLLKVHGMWVLKRVGALNDSMLLQFAADEDGMVRVHAMRVMAETPTWSDRVRAAALAGLQDRDFTVERCAADAIGQHPQLENVRPLLDALEHAAPADKHLIHTLRMALRNQLNENSIAEKLPMPGWNDADAAHLLDVAAGATSTGATLMLVKELAIAPANAANLANGFQHVGRFGSDALVEELAASAPARFAADKTVEFALFEALYGGVAQRKGAVGPKLREWGTALATDILTRPADDFGGWIRRPLPGESSAAVDIWSVEQRRCADGATAPFISSLPAGETKVGVIRSVECVLPAQLSFYVAGHDRNPTSPHVMLNVVRLIDSATGRPIATAPAPGNDVAQKVTWDLTPFAGKKGYVEATDGNDGTAYAWLSFGRFDPPVVVVPAASARNPLLSAIEIAGDLKLSNLTAQVVALMADRKADVDARVAAAKALPALSATIDAHAWELVGILADTSAPSALREASASALQSNSSPQTLAAFIEAIRTAPQKLQLSLAKSLAATSQGASALLDGIEAGKASPRLLQDANVIERLRISRPEGLEARVKKLTANLPPADVAIQSLINERSRTFNPKKANASHGKQIFTQNCAVCHSIGGVGAHVGPQLDGIGTRGVPRLSEDILDPSRNVDAAFRYNTYQLLSGDVLAGIPRREEGDTITIADASGKEVKFSKSTVKRMAPSNLSLMPSNFGEIIKTDDFDDLMAYLLTQQAK